MYAPACPSDAQQHPESNTAAPYETASCIVLPALPDEALMSIVGRFHILSGNTTTSSTFHELFNCSPFNLSAWIPPHVEVLAKRLGNDIVRHTLEVLRSTTLYPLLTIFNGVSSWPMTLNSQAPSTRRHSAPEPLRLCLRCLHEDMTDFGVPYIHLSHQIPGVEVCGRHSIFLLYKCPFCERLMISRNGELVLIPWHQCVCNNYVFDASETQVGIGDPLGLSYAKFTTELLTSRINAVPPSMLVECYRTRAREMGFEWRSDRVNRTQLMTEMEKFYGKEFLSRADAAYRHQKLACWFRMLGSTTAPEPPLGRHLLLAYFLFREAVHFRVALDMLAKEIPIERKPKPPKFKSKSTISPTDHELAWKLRERSADLYSSCEKPKKVTANRVILDINWNPYIHNKYIFPESMLALKEIPESGWYFYARRIIWAKLAYKCAPDVVVRRKAGIKTQHGVVLMKFFQDIDLSTPLRPGIVTKLLTDRGIYRDWEGPCPEREFAPTGRSFYKNI